MQAAFAVPLIGSRLSLLSYIFPCFVKHRILGCFFFLLFVGIIITKDFKNYMSL